MLDSVIMSIVDGNKYSYMRNENPAAEALENKLASIYGAQQVMITSCGMEAITMMFDFLLPGSGKIIIDQNTYYETRQWISMYTSHKMKLADMQNMDELEQACEGANIVYLDSPDMFGRDYDISQIAAIAHRHNALLAVDNSIVSIYYQNPLELGADIVVESYSKYVTGHGDVMAGCIAFKKLSAEQASSLKIFAGRRGRSLSPFAIYMIKRGLETLEVRMERHTQTAMLLYHRLRHANVETWYAGRGGILILPGMTKNLCQKLKVFKCLPTFGTTYSTCGYVRSADLYNQIGNYVRLSCGLEKPILLMQDLEQALGVDLGGSYA